MGDQQQANGGTPNPVSEDDRKLFAGGLPQVRKNGRAISRGAAWDVVY